MNHNKFKVRKVLEDVVEERGLENFGGTVLYTPPIKRYDFPSMGFSVHIHGSSDGNTLYGGSIKMLNGSDQRVMRLTGYDCAMIDLSPRFAISYWNRRRF